MMIVGRFVLLGKVSQFDDIQSKNYLVTYAWRKKPKSTSLKGIISVPCIDVDLEESQPRTKIYLYQKQ